MDSIRIRSDSIGSRLVSPRNLVAWLCLLTLGLALPALAATQNPDAARDALEEGLRLGKLGTQSYDQLMRQFSARSRARILVRVASPNEPFAGLSGPKARNRATRRARQLAIARTQAGLMGRPEMRTLRGVKRFRHVPYIALEVDAEELSRLMRQPEVTSISSDELLQLSLNDTVPQIGADLAWLQGYTGNGQVIAILDGGFDTSHPAFAGRIVDEACYSTTSFIDNTTTLCPNGDKPSGEDSQVGPGAAIHCDDMLGCDHGTHVAGIAAGDDDTYRGIAPDAGILPIQVFSRLNGLLACGFAPPCLSAFTSDVVRGLERVYELRDTYPIAVVNMSLGGEGYATAAACDAAYPAVQAAVDNLRSAGITTVVASGNEGQTGAIGTPACVSSAVSVGAVDVIDTVAYFSNSADYLDTLSGGVGIVSAVPGDAFAAKSGTSMAAPSVAGAVAVLRSADPGASPDEIVDVIKTTGVPITDSRNGLVTPRVQVDAAADLLTDGDLAGVALALVAEPELSGLDQPVGITHAGDGSGRLFIMQRVGNVLVRDATGVLPVPFLDLSAKVDCCSAEGLLGLVFHPNHGTNGQVYVSYATSVGEIVVERYTVSGDPNEVDPASGFEIIRIASTLDGHLGGRLHFGPDGYLYIATGDGAVDGTVPLPGASGDPGSLLGKILRIDVDAPGVPYTVPPDNPLLGTAGALGEIWALGLRDPRRFSIDALSGELYVADVGESDAHEVNVQAADSAGGEDYGWNIMEGSNCRAGQACDPTSLTLPEAEYGFAEGCAVTGGVVYRGANHADLYGAYLFGDLCSGRIWGLRSQDGAWQQVQMTQAAVQVSAFGSDESGEAYLVDRAAGQVYRLAVSNLAIDTVRLSTAFAGVPYDETLSATGGAAPYQWSIVTGALPAGLSLDPITGALSGSAVVAGATVFTVQVQDVEFATVARTLRITVTPPPLVIETLSLPEADTDSAYSATLEASGGTPPYAWAVSGGALPAGITLNTDGTLSGTPTEQGAFSFDATVTDDVGDQRTQSLEMSVFGATLSLQLNVTDPGAYGKGYGSDQHVLGLDATFIGTGTDLRLEVTGYDIDYADELLVSLNGNPLGYLSVGPNEALNAGDSFAIPAALQLPGANLIRFQVKTSGWMWGVTNLLLTDAPPPLGITTTALSDATFAQPYSATLEATGGKAPYT
ncbi:MAG: PQQ-dependent sugar dehydrogenase, partial [Gammaproteobacteria bacterium]|nr:PQQ-dependent sugar dehydrogenase [Gammaproteobacteria bacterium]MDX2459243.1 PQQ-dependent sugar dehydrogenase [Gammaproteobacteria bacterium]